MFNQSTLKPKTFAYSALSLAILGLPFLAQAEAQTTQQLGDIYVTGKKKANRKDNEVTGLGKIVKSSDSISKEQVLGIRDLVRYDPGVTVVEQGRGASAGYAMRGVDKNRVALVVDGIPQTQSYVVQGYINGVASAGGSINEIENENIASVEISKGASSAEYGSGSLGGALGFRTKDPSDLLQGGKKWGLSTKSAYSSKNSQLTNSIGFATRQGGFEGLVQYTYKKGKSTQIHKDAIHTANYNITRLGAYENIYDLRTPNTFYSNWFVIEDEQCNGATCQPRPSAAVSEDITPYLNGREPSSEEATQIAQAAYIKEALNGENYTGPNRVMPDPMQYKTNSWLVKLGYHFNPQHYLGFTLEDTAQRYDIRNMGYRAYYIPSERRQFNTGEYRAGESPLFSIHMHGSVPIGLGWTRTQFFDENHTKRRQGLVYRYTGHQESLFDAVNFSVDKQDNILTVLEHKRHCAPYPTVDKHCRPSVDKPYSYYNSERNKYREHHHFVKLSLDKKFEVLSTKHSLNLLTGLDIFKSSLSRSDYAEEYSTLIYDTIRGRGTKEDPYIKRQIENKLHQRNLCDSATSAFSSCNTRTITGDNKFIALRDNVRLNKYLDIGLGGRYDIHRFRSTDPWTSSKDYRTFSWNLGVVVKPISAMALSYRVSNGFRVPSFQELFGFREAGLEQGRHDAVYKASNLAPEKAMNQEFGIGFRGDFGSLEMSYFKNHYQNMITLARDPSTTPAYYQYYNAQDVKLNGINLVGTVDWHGVFEKLPEGLYSTLAYNRIKPQSITNHAKLTDIRSYIFDAVQPSRYIVGLGYDDPEEKWGINAIMTYSKGKNPSEVQSKRFNNLQNKEQTINATNKTARSWYIFDLIGYVNVRDFLTLRAGIYNVMNYRYATWESLRQSAAGSLNQHRNIENYARYAAPGRNFTLSLEMKF